MRRQQNRIGYSLTEHQRQLDARLTGAFLFLTHGLAVSAVPAETRSWWYNASRRDTPVHPKGRDAVVAGQLVLQAAIATQDTTVIEGTAEAVARYFDELKAVALEPYTMRVGGSVQSATEEALKEGHEGLQAIAMAGLKPWCRATKETALREVREMVDAARAFLTGCEREVFAITTHQKHATGARS